MVKTIQLIFVFSLTVSKGNGFCYHFIRVKMYHRMKSYKDHQAPQRVVKMLKAKLRGKMFTT